MVFLARCSWPAIPEAVCLGSGLKIKHRIRLWQGGRVDGWQGGWVAG